MTTLKRASVLLLALMFAAVLFGCTMGGANGSVNYRIGLNGTTAPEETEPEENGYENGEGEEWPGIFINGEGLPGSYFLILDSQGNVVEPGTSYEYIFPTHLPLIMVAEALDAEVNWNIYSGAVALTGLNGNITFEAGSNEFHVEGNAEPIALAQSSAVIDGILYVPSLFFRDVFGAGSVTASGGQVDINIHAPDDMH